MSNFDEYYKQFEALSQNEATAQEAQELKKALAEMEAVYAELQNFYFIHQALIQNFKGVDNQFKMWLNEESFNVKAVESLLPNLPLQIEKLNELNVELAFLEQQSPELNKQIQYIQEKMLLSETSMAHSRFLKSIENVSNNTKVPEPIIETPTIPQKEKPTPLPQKDIYNMKIESEIIMEMVIGMSFDETEEYLLLWNEDILKRVHIKTNNLEILYEGNIRGYNPSNNQILTRNREWVNVESNVVVGEIPEEIINKRQSEIDKHHGYICDDIYYYQDCYISTISTIFDNKTNKIKYDKLYIIQSKHTSFKPLCLSLEPYFYLGKHFSIISSKYLLHKPKGCMIEIIRQIDRQPFNVNGITTPSNNSSVEYQLLVDEFIINISSDRKSSWVDNGYYIEGTIEKIEIIDLNNFKRIANVSYTKTLLTNTRSSKRIQERPVSDFWSSCTAISPSKRKIALHERDFIIILNLS